MTRETLGVEEIESVRQHLRRHEWGETGDEVCDLALKGLESDWQPIESAPKDGDPLDLWAVHNGRSYRITDAWWGLPHHECGEAGPYCDNHPTEDGWCDMFGYIQGTPTHWRRPAPPEPPTREEVIAPVSEHKDGSHVAQPPRDDEPVAAQTSLQKVQTSTPVAALTGGEKYNRELAPALAELAQEAQKVFANPPTGMTKMEPMPADEAAGFCVLCGVREGSGEVHTIFCTHKSADPGPIYLNMGERKLAATEGLVSAPKTSTSAPLDQVEGLVKRLERGCDDADEGCALCDEAAQAIQTLSGERDAFEHRANLLWKHKNELTDLFLKTQAERDEMKKERDVWHRATYTEHKARQGMEDLCEKTAEAEHSLQAEVSRLKEERDKETRIAVENGMCLARMRTERDKLKQHVERLEALLKEAQPHIGYLLPNAGKLADKIYTALKEGA